MPYTSTFFDNGKVIIVKVFGNHFLVITLNIVDGSISNKQQIDYPSLLKDQYGDLTLGGCNYANNVLYLSSKYDSTTVSIRAYDLPDLKLKWEKKYSSYLYYRPIPYLSDKYVIIPINSNHSLEKTVIYFLDLKGKEVTGIPLDAGDTDGVAYFENSITYNYDNFYVVQP